jgi:phage shock protein C
MSTEHTTKPARLYRSRDDRVIAGVAGGLASYLGVDPVLVRLVIVVLAVAGGSGVLAYVIAWIVIPEEPWDGPAEEPAERVPRTRPAAGGTTRIVVGLALVVVGIGLLAEWAFPAFDDVFWPLAVIAAGAGLVYYGANR